MRNSSRAAKTLLPVLALVLAGAMAPAIADSGNESSNQGGVIYNSIPNLLPGNLDSVGFESVAFNEFGNALNFTSRGAHVITKVVVTMSSWGCASIDASKNCITPEDATFSQPITLNIYSPSTDGGFHPGSKLASITKTFNIKYRPSTSPLCTGVNAGKWYAEDSKTCYNGLAQNITFDANNLKVDGGAIFGITYNTSDYGYAPILTAPCRSTSAGCPYDSLNVAVTQDPTDVTAGSSTVPGKLWLNSPSQGDYADAYHPYDPTLANTKPYYGWVPLTNPTNISGTFRMDSPNAAPWWGSNYPGTSAPWYVPAIQVVTTRDQNGIDHSTAKSTVSHSDSNTGDSRHGIKQG